MEQANGKVIVPKLMEDFFYNFQTNDDMQLVLFLSSEGLSSQRDGVTVEERHIESTPTTGTPLRMHTLIHGQISGALLFAICMGWS